MSSSMLIKSDLFFDVVHAVFLRVWGLSVAWCCVIGGHGGLMLQKFRST